MDCSYYTIVSFTTIYLVTDNGYYAYIETSSPRVTNDAAELISDTFIPTTGIVWNKNISHCIDKSVLANNVVNLLIDHPFNLKGGGVQFFFGGGCCLQM